MNETVKQPLPLSAADNKNLYLPMNLQFFADPEDEAEDDNLEDDEFDGLEDDDLSEDDLDDEEKDGEEEPDEQEEETEEEESEEEDPETVEFTPAQQKKIDALFQQRLGRNNSEYAKKLRAVENATGMTIDQVIETVRRNKLEQLIESGMSEEEAQAIVEKDSRLAELEEKQREFENQQREFFYHQQKSALIKNPIVKQYEADIDAFSQNGMILDFENAAAYVIGRKVLEGEVLENVRKGAANKVKADIQKRSKAAPEKGKSRGASADVTLTREQRIMARNFGLDPREVAKTVAKIEKEKGKRK